MTMVGYCDGESPDCVKEFKFKVVFEDSNLSYEDEFTIEFLADRNP